MSDENGISEVTIFNAALIHLGHDTLVTADDPGKTAVVCRQRYPNLRDALIRSYPWNFSTLRAALPEHAEPPAFGYAHRYRLPTDCLKVFRVEGASAAPWMIESSFIVTDLGAPLQIRYGRREVNPQLFDPLFIEVLAIDLAVAISPKAGDKRTQRLDLRNLRDSIIERAEFADADEAVEEDIPDGDWITARHQ